MSRAKLTHCQRGHPLDEANTHLYQDKRGRVRRVCRKCAKMRNPFRERLYGVSREEYAELVSDQNGVCALCGRASEERALAVDHDHASGVVRGLLCAPCNTGLGVFRDDPRLLRRAIGYLEAYRRGHDAPLVEQRVLRAGDRDYLTAAFEMVLDEFTGDIESLAAGRPFTDTLMWTHLPDAFAGIYDLRFAVQFLVGTALLRDRVADGVAFPARCVAEELALRAVMRTAVVNATETGDLHAADRLDAFADSLLPDTDFLPLFEKEFHLSLEQARSIGATHLWPEDWFRSFDLYSSAERSALN